MLCCKQTPLNFTVNEHKNDLGASLTAFHQNLHEKSDEPLHMSSSDNVTDMREVNCRTRKEEPK